MAFGIDFGTTNSAVVFESKTLLHTGTDRPFPSVVAIDHVTGEIICGPRAKELRGSLEAGGYTVISSVKRHLGKNTVFRAGAKMYGPKEIATELFKGLKAHVASKSDRVEGRPLDEAVVSIPVGFPPERRRLLREAAQDAGIRITSFVSEPTAAYIHCRDELPPCARVAVFDWGGGTLDVSVLQIHGDRIIELATEAREEAGDDIDDAIARWAHAQILAGRPNAPPFDLVLPIERDRLIVQCEGAKVELTTSASTQITLSRYVDRDDYPLVALDRPRLRTLLNGFIDRAVRTLDEALLRAAAVAGRAELDQVLLIGGSSKLVALEERFQSLFPGKIHHPPKDADWVVAQGASELSAEPQGGYELAQRLCLVLCDGAGHVLARPGDRFDDKPRPYHFGIVEEADAAELVFAEDLDAGDLAVRTTPRLRQIGNISVPMQGFHSEPLRLEARLTHDLTFRVDAKSVNGIDEDRVSWEYPQLRFTYSMPVRAPSETPAATLSEALKPAPTGMPGTR